MKRSAMLFLALAFTFHVSSASAATQYTLTRLGAFGAYPVSGSASSYAYAVNDLGSVAGHVASAGGQGNQAFLWKNDVMTPLGMLGGPCTTAGCRSFAYGINDSDVVVGSSATPPGASPYGDMAFRWNQGTGMTGLGWLDPVYNCSVGTARGITNFGLIVGTVGIYAGNMCGVTDVNSKAFLFMNTTMYPLTGIDTGTDIYAQANAINRYGVIVGRSDGPGQNGAFVWTSGGSVTWLGDLGARSGGGHTSYAYGINDTTDVVGSSTSPRGSYEAFFWTPTSGGTMVGLGDLAGGLFDSRAYGINNSRQVVGSSYSSFGPEAFIWDGISGMVSLNTLLIGAPGWWLVEARDINNSGQIVGWGRNPSGGTEAFLLTPAPVASPFIAFSPANFGFSGGVGGANPESQTLEISNDQTGTLSWTVSPGASWLSLDPTAGQVTGLEKGLVTVSVNLAGLAAGTYSTSVEITGNATNSPQSVPVSLTILPVITITYPNGGEVLRSGSTVSITWDVNPPEQTVAKTDTFYTKDGGSTWTLIKSQKGLKTSYNWRVPSVKNPTECRVLTRFMNAAGQVIAEDTSDTTFQIVK